MLDQNQLLKIIVLITQMKRQNVAGLLLYGSADEKEDLASTMEWLSVRNPEWRIDRCDTVNQLPKIIGYRIANNLFHEKRIGMQQMQMLILHR